MAATRYAQQRKVIWQIFVDGKDRGFFTEAEGSGLSAEKVQYGDGPVGTGTPSREDLKLTRPYSDADVEMEDQFEEGLLDGSEVLANRSIAGDDGLPMGAPKKFTGVLLGVVGPQGNATANERAMLEITVGLNTKAAR